MKIIFYTCLSQLLGFAVFAITAYIPIEGIYAFLHIFSSKFLKLTPTYLVMLFFSLSLLSVAARVYKLTLVVCMLCATLSTLLTSFVLAQLLKMENIDLGDMTQEIIIGASLGSVIFGYVMWLLVNKGLSNVNKKLPNNQLNKSIPPRRILSKIAQNSQHYVCLLIECLRVFGNRFPIIRRRFGQ